MAKPFTGGFSTRSGRGKVPMRWISWHGRRFQVPVHDLPDEEKIAQEYRFRPNELAFTPEEERKVHMENSVKDFASSVAGQISIHKGQPKGGVFGHVANVATALGVASHAARLAQNIRSGNRGYRQVGFAVEEKYAQELSKDITTLTSAKEEIEADLKKVDLPDAKRIHLNNDLQRINSSLTKSRAEIDASAERLKQPKFEEFLHHRLHILGPEGYRTYANPTLKHADLKFHNETQDINKEIIARAKNLGSQEVAIKEAEEVRKARVNKAAEGTSDHKQKQWELEVFNAYTDKRYHDPEETPTGIVISGPAYNPEDKK